MATKNRTYYDTQNLKCNDSDSLCEECWQNIQSKEGISNLQQIMQNQNQFLKSMLLQLLEEVKKTSIDKDLPLCLEGERVTNDAMRRELKKLRKENKKIKETLSEKQANLAKCLTVLENSNSDIDKLSKHIEALCAERDKYREEINKMQCIISKKDSSIYSYKETLSKVGIISNEKEKFCQEVKILRDQLEKCKIQYCNKEKSYHREIKDLKIENLRYKELYKDLKCDKCLRNETNSKYSDCSELEPVKQLCNKSSGCSEEPNELCGLILRLKHLEKELEASNLELSEYEEENRCYCQKIESLLKTIKCLQEAKLRSEEDSVEYCERLSSMRLEFQEMCEEKNKIIENVNCKLKEMGNKEQEISNMILQKDIEMKKLRDDLSYVRNEHCKCKVIEQKYQECQKQFDCYSKQLQTLQTLLNETYSKLDSCDKTIKDLENRNKLLEEKILDLENSLDEKVDGVGNWEIMLKELQFINLKLQRELRNKECIIKNLEDCLDKSNQILANCEKEMSLVDKRNTKFKREMCYIKSKLQGELLQNQCLAIKCNILNDENYKCLEGCNINESIVNLKSQYLNLLSEAVAKQNEIGSIKAELVKCFDKEADATFKFRTIPCSPCSSEQGTARKCVDHLYTNNKPRETRKWSNCRARSQSPNKMTSNRSRSCPARKSYNENVRKIPSAPSFHGYAKPLAEVFTDIKPQIMYKSDDESSEVNKLPTGVKSLVQYHKTRKTILRDVRSDGNLKKNIKKVSNLNSCCTKRVCKCMTVITRKYKNEKKKKRKNCEC